MAIWTGKVIWVCAAMAGVSGYAWESMAAAPYAGRSRPAPLARPSARSIDPSFRWRIGLVGGLSFLSPGDLQTFLHDSEKMVFAYDFGILAGYRISRALSLEVEATRKTFSRSNSPDSPNSSDEFDGSYGANGYATFVFFGYEVFNVDGPGRTDRFSSVQAQDKDSISVSGLILAGPGMAFGNRVEGQNGYGEKLRTGAFAVPGAAAMFDLRLSRADIPLELSVGAGYRFFEAAELGASGRMFSWSAPVLRVVLGYVF
jgi:hypothetical protein